MLGVKKNLTKLITGEKRKTISGIFDIESNVIAYRRTDYESPPLFQSKGRVRRLYLKLLPYVLKTNCKYTIPVGEHVLDPSCENLPFGQTTQGGVPSSEKEPPGQVPVWGDAKKHGTSSLGSSGDCKRYFEHGGGGGHAHTTPRKTTADWSGGGGG